MTVTLVVVFVLIILVGASLYPTAEQRQKGRMMERLIKRAEARDALESILGGGTFEHLTEQQKQTLMYKVLNSNYPID